MGKAITALVISLRLASKAASRVVIQALLVFARVNFAYQERFPRPSERETLRRAGRAPMVHSALRLVRIQVLCVRFVQRAHLVA